MAEYERAVHDHGHQIEIMLEHVDNNMMQNNYIGPGRHTIATTVLVAVFIAAAGHTNRQIQ